MGKQCRVSVHLEPVVNNQLLQFEKNIERHNFVNKIKLVLPTRQSSSIKSFLDSKEFNQLTINATLSEIVAFLLDLDVSTQNSVKLFTLDRDITHQNTICVANGELTLKIDSETYHRSGFKFKLSSFSKGNKKFKNQMYIHSFKLATFGENNDINDTRLLWFMSNIDKTQYHWAINAESNAALECILQSKLKLDTQRPSISIIDNEYCGVPYLEIDDNKEFGREHILQWLTTEGEDAPDIGLDEGLDPYAANFREVIYAESERDVCVIIISGTLISSEAQLHILRHLLESVGTWFGFLTFGVKHILRSYGTKGEHGFLNNGSNDLITFVNVKNSISWNVIDSSDPN